MGRGTFELGRHLFHQASQKRNLAFAGLGERQRMMDMAVAQKLAEEERKSAEKRAKRNQYQGSLFNWGLSLVGTAATRGMSSLGGGGQGGYSGNNMASMYNQNSTFLDWAGQTTVQTSEERLHSTPAR